MGATDQRLVGRCAVEEGHACLGCQRHVNVQPERPFRMHEADRRIDRDVACKTAPRCLLGPLSSALRLLTAAVPSRGVAGAGIDLARGVLPSAST
jgi:hypothetical protein